MTFPSGSWWVKDEGDLLPAGPGCSLHPAFSTAKNASGFLGALISCNLYWETRKSSLAELGKNPGNVQNWGHYGVFLRVRCASIPALIPVPVLTKFRAPGALWQHLKDNKCCLRYTQCNQELPGRKTAWKDEKPHSGILSCSIRWWELRAGQFLLSAPSRRARFFLEHIRLGRCAKFGELEKTA